MVAPSSDPVSSQCWTSVHRDPWNRFATGPTDLHTVPHSTTHTQKIKPVAPAKKGSFYPYPDPDPPSNG